MQHLSHWISIVVIGLVGCVSTSGLDHSSLQSDKATLCSQKRREFVVIASTKIPKGLSVDEVGSYQDRVGANIERLNTNFLSVIGSAYFERAEDGALYPRVLSSGSYSIEPLYGGQDSHGRPDMRLDWVGGNTFLYWDSKTANRYEHSSSLTYSTVNISTPKGVYAVPMKKCDGFYSASFEQSVCASLQGERRHQVEYRLNNLDLPSTGVFSFIADSHFNIGSLFQTHYFSMSPDEKIKLGISASNRSESVMVDQVVNRSNEILTALLSKSDRASIKVDGEWIISQHVINLTDICKYARPTTDFVAD